MLEMVANPTVTIFSSIEGIARTLRDADPTIPLEVLTDGALSGYGGTINFEPSSLRDETKLALKKAEVLISEPTVIAELLEHDASALSNLKWCQSTYAGVDPIFKSKLAFPLPFKLTRFAGCFGPPIAEWCMARIIAHERGFAASTEDQKNKLWAGSKDDILRYRYLSTLTLTVLGCGDIGMCVARAAKAFGMKTVGYGKTNRVRDKVDGIDEFTTNLTNALQVADYIISILPSTPDTRGMLNDDVLQAASRAKAGRCPVFLNVGRGDIISEKSLLNALDQKWISAAILDVFEVEPLPEESLFWKRSDVIISPHVSGLTHGDDVPKVFLSNYNLFVEGKQLNFLVDWDKGY
jgi:phosphoglycerate dehydrogenase-like enzyme